VSDAEKVPCDGCKTVARLAAKVRPGNEDDYYEFKRAARHHRKECPNK
jgi:hypothetical protein